MKNKDINAGHISTIFDIHVLVLFQTVNKKHGILIRENRTTPQLKCTQWQMYHDKIILY